MFTVYPGELYALAYYYAALSHILPVMSLPCRPTVDIVFLLLHLFLNDWTISYAMKLVFELMTKEH